MELSIVEVRRTVCLIDKQRLGRSPIHFGPARRRQLMSLRGANMAAVIVYVGPIVSWLKMQTKSRRRQQLQQAEKLRNCFG